MLWLLPDGQTRIVIDLTGPLLAQVLSRPLLRAQSPVLRAAGAVLLIQSTATLVFAAGLDLARALGLPVIQGAAASRSRG